MKQMHLAACVDLPAEEFEEAAAKLKVKPIWETFLRALSDADVLFVAKLETLETRAKTAGAKRGRPRKPPVLVPPPSGEAA